MGFLRFLGSLFPRLERDEILEEIPSCERVRSDQHDAFQGAKLCAARRTLEQYWAPSADSKYPPDFPEIREKVFQRDGWRCQVTGCINSSANATIECHHVVSVANGGTHELDNLVTLCQFHHAVLEDHGLVWPRIPSDRYSIVEGFWKKKKRRSGRFFVGSHPKRHVLVTASELGAVRNEFGLVCPKCHSSEWRGWLKREQVIVICPQCLLGWTAMRGLREETGPALATVLVARANLGRFSLSNENLEVVTRLYAVHSIHPCPWCVEDGKMGYLQLKNGSKGRFYGCVNWKPDGSGCPYTRSG